MRKPKALTKEELQLFKQRLLDLRARLRGDVSQMAEVALGKNRGAASGEISSMPIHMAELGTDNYEQEFTLSLIEASSGVLEQIELALERLEEGTYGICEDCGCQIPKQRLQAIPYATMCVKCASKYEQT